MTPREFIEAARPLLATLRAAKAAELLAEQDAAAARARWEQARVRSQEARDAFIALLDREAAEEQGTTNGVS